MTILAIEVRASISTSGVMVPGFLLKTILNGQVIDVAYSIFSATKQRDYISLTYCVGF